MRRLLDVLTNDYGLDLAGWTLTRARAISSDGRSIVGEGVHNGNQEAWLAQIPEPSSGAPLIVTIAALPMRRKRRARSSW